ncbi:MAG: cell division protein ZapA [Pacificimonas sp.]|jgi:cell division protein ZapA|nr:cell division protein ZapA [Pacificimonas sp.]
MAEVRVEVGGRIYPLACKDGEEPLIENLAAAVNEKATSLTDQLGHIPEVRLLLMSAIMIADDLIRGSTARDGGMDQDAGEPAAPPAAPEATREAEARAAEAVELAIARVETLAASLETGAPAA